MALVEQANLVIQLSLKDQVSKGVRGVQTNLGKLDKSFSNTQQALGRTGTNIKRFGVGIGVAIAGGAAVAIREFSNFEASMNTINTVAQLNQEQLDGVGDSIRKLARDSGTELSELTTGYYDLVSAGVAAADAQGVLEAANTLAIGGLATTGETIDLLTTAINAYGLEASDAADVADYFAQSIAAGKVTAADLAASFATVAPIAASTGIEIEELAAAYGVMTAAGVPAAEASTQMRSAIVALMRPTAALEKLEKDLGVSFKEIAEEEGLAVAYQRMTEEAGNAGVEMIELTGRVEGTQFALQVAGENADKYNEALDDVRTSTEGAGVAAEQAEQRQKGLDFQFRRLRAHGRDLAIVFGERLAPAVGNVADRLSELLENRRGDIEKMADQVGGLIDKIATPENLEKGLSGALNFLRDMPWSTISAGLKITGEAAKLVIDTFRSLPPDIQKILIGALAVNKVTGGLLTGVVRDLAGIALKSLTTINAAHVTVVGNAVAGGGGAAAGAGGAAAASRGGMLVNTLKVLGAATFAGFGLFELFNTLGRQQQEVVDANRSIDQSLLDLAASNPTEAQINAQIAAMQAVPGKLDPIQQALFNMNVNGVKTTWEAGLNELIAIKGRLNVPQPGDPGFIGPVPIDPQGNEERILRQNNAVLADRVTGSITNLGNRLGADLVSLRTSDDDMFRSLQSVVRNAGSLTVDQLGAVKAKLDTNNNGIISMREVTRAGLSATRGQLVALNRKDFSPNVTTNVTVRSQFNVSARAIAAATRTYHVNARPRPV